MKLRYSFVLSRIALPALLVFPLAVFADTPKQSADLAAKKTEGGILFQCSAPGANAVYLAGDFNNWAEANNGTISDAKYKMDGPDANGVWTKIISLAPGEHKFKFSVGGVAEGWFAPDWAKKDSEGNGVITITSDGEIAGDNAAAGTAGPAASASVGTSGTQTVTFHFTAPDASTVYLAGDFNTWGENKEGVVSDPKYAMSKGNDGVWQMDLSLSPGKHSYKFVVDGSKWENDPSQAEKDGEGNSVVEVK